MILITDIEDRLLRACKTLRAVPDPHRKFQSIQSPWPETVRNPEDAYGYNDQIMPRFRPSPADVSDMLVALAWARALDKKEFKLIWWRSFDDGNGHPTSFFQIGLRLGRSKDTARNRYKDAIIKCWHEANTVAFLNECSTQTAMMLHG